MGVNSFMIIDAYILMKWIKFYKMLFKSSDKSRIKSIILKLESRVDLNLLFNEFVMQIYEYVVDVNYRFYIMRL